MKLRSLRLLLLFLLLVPIDACVPTKPQGETSPLAWSDFSSPLPPTTEAPKPGFVNICGVVMLVDPTIIAPREDGLYLVHIEVNSASETNIVIPVVNLETSLQADVDEASGYFCFKDVPLGLYALVSVTDMGTQISARNFETGQAMIVNVTQEDLGKEIDLGMVRLP